MQIEKTPEPLPHPYIEAHSPYETTARMAATATTLGKRAQCKLINHRCDLGQTLVMEIDEEIFLTSV
jgi:hypothetical protein